MNELTERLLLVREAGSRDARPRPFAVISAFLPGAQTGVESFEYSGRGVSEAVSLQFSIRLMAMAFVRFIELLTSASHDHRVETIAVRNDADEED